MDESLREQKATILLAFSCAQRAGDDGMCAEVLNAMVRHHGDDPTICFVLIDHYFLIL